MRCVIRSFFPLFLCAYFFGSLFSLEGHGFVGSTPIPICNKTGTVYLSDVCWRVVKKWKQWCIATYNLDNTTLEHGTVIHSAMTTTPSCVYLTYGDADGIYTDAIICTPWQEFYLYDTREWVPLYALIPGMRLTSLDGYHVLISLEQVAEEQEVYSIEVQNTHTFFAGKYGLLTHNMVLPWALSAGFSIPFGAAAGGTTGSFFGPVTMLAGATIGTIIGAVIEIALNRQMPLYDLGINNDIWQNVLFVQNTGPSNDRSQLPAGNNDGLDPKQPKKDDDKEQLPGTITGAKKLADEIAEKYRKQTLEESRRLTNKEARELVRENLAGYEEKPNPPFRTHGNVAFYNKKTNTWISADRDCHNGGVWKMFRGSKREGTFDALLTKKIKG